MLQFPWPSKFSNFLVSQNWLLHLSIRNKVILGYGLAAGVALGGSLVGLGLGAHFHHQASLQMADALEEKRLPIELQTELMRSRMHRKEVVALIEQPQLMQQEVQNYHLHAARVKQAWVHLKDSYANPTVEESEKELLLFRRLVQEYDQVLQDYFYQVDRLFVELDAVDRAALTPEKIAAIRNQWLVVSLHPSALKLRNLTDDLDRIIAIALEEEEEATLALSRAERLEQLIILSSLMVAGMTAALCAWLVSRIITAPLEKTTQIAHQVIQTQNFDLQVPQITYDEVGILTDTINHLIRRVKQLLAERLTSEAQLVQAEKMATLGQLVAGIAHEINNPINFIHGNLTYANEYMQQLLHLVHLVETQCPDLPPQLKATIEEMDLAFVKDDSKKLFRSMQVGTERIRDIVLALRIFSRVDEAAFKAVDIHEGIDSTLMILGDRLREKSDHPKIQVIKEYGQLPLVQCYVGQLNQVFMNLIANAIDALEEYYTQEKFQCDTIAAFGKNWQANPGDIRHQPEIGWIKIKTYCSGKNSVSIHIANNGSYIPEAVRSRIFDPFFTTKPVGKGTGLGLSISYQIITEKHRGKLYCFSTPDQCTEFVVTIPIQQV